MFDLKKTTTYMECLLKVFVLPEKKLYTIKNNTIKTNSNFYKITL